MLQRIRRARDESLNRAKYLYLKLVEEEKFDSVYDLYCPPFLYESTETGPLKFTRSQLFAISCQVKSLDEALPEWISHPKEQEEAEQSLKRAGVTGDFIAVSLRGTCSTRTYPPKYAEVLLERLSRKYAVVYFDSVRPYFRVPRGVVFASAPFEIFCSMVRLSRMVLTVDSCMMHVAQAVHRRSVVIFSATDSSALQRVYQVTPVECKLTRCGGGCNYNGEKGWKRDTCRSFGCLRMHANVPDLVEAAVDEVYSLC